MKKFLITIAILGITAFSFAQKAGEKITFTATDLNGRIVTSEIFEKNKVTMLNIWGTFCGPCIREMP
ncbi:MAG: TlpA family protein disulfide reductase, partial [Treponema sp.]|nr:TlpA family protein disulfide reductase [Treponema sp.]